MSAVRIFTKASWSLLTTQAGALAVIAIAAFFTRALPLSFSPYPFNNDGLTESHLAAHIIDTGRLLTSSNGLTGTIHSEAIPILNVLAAFVAASLGVSPFFCAQAIVSIVSVVTVGGLFLLGRDFTGKLIGGMAASFPALFVGTFVFTTASFWKEALGFAFVVMVLIGFMRRDEGRFRTLCFASLMLLPLVHHLVTAVALLAISFPVAWSLFLALARNSVRTRHLLDLLMIAIPAIWTQIYYSSVSFDRFESLSSPLSIALMAVGFTVLSGIGFFMLMMKRHAKLTFAPLIGLGIVVAMTLDYFGFLFNYEPSVKPWYFVLIASFALLFVLAWYGTEVMLEKKRQYRSIQLGLLLSPLAIIGYGIAGGISEASQQLAYRTFDFVDLFVFLGCAAGVSTLFSSKSRTKVIVASAILFLSVASFPFAYDSELLGVRHDSNAYEVDAINWIPDHMTDIQIVTDERLGYMSKALIGAKEESSFPTLIERNLLLQPNMVFILEDDWQTQGVNNFPGGLVVVPPENFTVVLDLTNVVYVGGPSTDRVLVLLGTYIGPYRYNNSTPYLSSP